MEKTAKWRREDGHQSVGVGGLDFLARSKVRDVSSSVEDRFVLRSLDAYKELVAAHPIRNKILHYYCIHGSSRRAATHLTDVNE